jgi:hypothetical protein
LLTEIANKLAKDMLGYSGTPLLKKLGLNPGQVVRFIGAPAGYLKMLGPLPEGVRVRNAEREMRSERLDFAQVFSKERTELEKLLPRLRKQIAPAGMIWVSWPKKSSGVATTVNEHVIRELALPMGLVDVKVCAVDEVWSGLKLVVRVRNR